MNLTTYTHDTDPLSTTKMYFNLGAQAIKQRWYIIPKKRRVQSGVLLIYIFGLLAYQGVAGITARETARQNEILAYQEQIAELEQALEAEQQNVLAQKEETEELRVSLEQHQAQMVAAAIPESAEDTKAWITEQNLCEEAPCNVPNGEAGCKSYNFTYMGYKSVKTKSSPQYKLLYGDTCYTDPSSGIRMVGDRYCIAVGTYYAPSVGTKLDLVMKNGSIIKCIVGDFKADCHTDSTNRYHTGGMDHGQYYEADGSVAEFIVDKSVFRGTSQYPEEASGRILKIVQIP